jgi:hypothetical protein
VAAPRKAAAGKAVRLQNIRIFSVDPADAASRKLISSELSGIGRKFSVKFTGKPATIAASFLKAPPCRSRPRPPNACPSRIARKPTSFRID